MKKRFFTVIVGFYNFLSSYSLNMVKTLFFQNKIIGSNPVKNVRLNYSFNLNLLEILFL